MTEKHKYNLKKKDVAYFMRRLYKKGLTTSSGGNISMRVDEGILITPSALDKGRIKGKQIGLVSFKGHNLSPLLTPSMETAMHLAIYMKRPDVNAIVHAHPLFATSFTAMKKEINCALTAEARSILGTPKTAKYALMGTKELADTVSKISLSANVILLENHGIVCLGANLLAAFDRIEVLEAAARMTFITDLQKDTLSLNEKQLREIDRMFS
jgi:L-fuculose-phosphate aldolase